jgi:hypothetical protein
MMRTIARPSGYAAALLLAGTAALAAPAAAQASAPIPGPPVVPCSSSALVAAIKNANSAGTATLRLSPLCSYVLTSAVSADDGLPMITGRLTVIGGPRTTISRSSSAGSFRILHVANSAALTLVNVTVANGSVPVSAGGGIEDEGTLVLRNVRLTGNTAGNGGGLSVNDGAHATISGSELEGNSATGAVGGAILNVGDLVIDRSILARNTVHFFGGGVNAQPGSTTRISHTVVTRNSAGNQGGGLVNHGTMVLTGDRVVFNQATTAGGGVLNANNGTVTLRFSVIAFNSPDNCNPQGIIAGCRN